MMACAAHAGVGRRLTWAAGKRMRRKVKRILWERFAHMSVLAAAVSLVWACSGGGSDKPAEVADVALDTGPAPDTGAPPGKCGEDADCGVSPWPCTTTRCTPEGVCAFVQHPDGTPCEDGDPCTATERCTSGTCKGGKDACHCDKAADCAHLEDGDLCNGVYFCDTHSDPHVCRIDATTLVTCAAPDDPQCAQALCDAGTGQCAVANLPDGTACEDGDACTAADACAKGACAAGKSVCPCKTTADCAAFEDDNVCNGKLYCDNTAFPYLCKVNPATVITCPSASDTACSKNTCDPISGSCAPKAVADKTACEDGSACTKGDVCLLGVCQPGVNACPCSKNADCGAFEDGDLCNGTLYCDLTLPTPGCVVNPATVVSCPTVDNTLCSQVQCQPKSGKCLPVAINEKGPCDDGNVCTVGDHCEAGECGSQTNTCKCVSQADCGQYEDGNLCNGTLYCDKSAAPFVCNINKTTVIHCPTGADTDCLRNTCQPKSGMCAMKPFAQGQACDADGNLCTVGDSCDAGVCIAGPNVCPCEKSGDCVQHEDGDLCNGTLYCDALSKPPVCRVNPNTVVTCAKGADSVCLRNVCAPAKGVCAMTPVRQGHLCEEDGNACTPEDACINGQCEVGDNVCACESDSDCAGKEDGDPCNGTLYCNKSALPFSCEVNPATVVTCDDSQDQPCRRNACQSKSGACALVDLPNNAACDDGLVCTAGDVCLDGQCQPGTPICGCKVDADCAPWDDGDQCNGLLYCDQSVAPHVCVPKPGSEVVCPSEKLPCAQVWCVPTTGLCASQPTADKDGTPCVDGNACTTGDSCAAGQCVGLPLQVSDACDDGNPCTLDGCNPVSGCTHFTQLVPCSDGDPCTVNDMCQAGKCAPGKNVCGCKTNADCQSKEDGNLCNGTLVCAVDKMPWDCVVDLATVVTCDAAADTECLAATCAPATGKCAPIPVNNGGPCDADGNVCTKGDTCADGACQAGKPVNCNDGNACTSDDCHAELGCQSTPTVADCSDGNACTEGEACVAGVCKGGAAKTCTDDNPCTWDACHPLKGCTFAPNSAPCDDGNPCTQDEACSGGKCAPTSAACACDKDLDCLAKDDGDLCNGVMYCDKSAGPGICRPKPDSAVTCAPKELQCGQYKCHPPTGLCQVFALADGTPCDADGSKCTVKDSCQAGQCKPGALLSCGDSEPCLARLCDPKAGCIEKAVPVGTVCDDADPCTVGDGCVAGKCKAGSPKPCDDGQACTIDSCDASGACLHLPVPPEIPKACDDNNLCTEGDACAAGLCIGPTQKNCDDANDCTQDSCQPLQGCLHFAMPGCNPDE